MNMTMKKFAVLGAFFVTANFASLSAHAAAEADKETKRVQSGVINFVGQIVVGEDDKTKTSDVHAQLTSGNLDQVKDYGQYKINVNALKRDDNKERRVATVSYH